MMKTIFILYFSIAAYVANAQSNLGSRLGGMGNPAVAIKDFWNIKFNPAGTTEILNPSISLSYIRNLYAPVIANQLAGLVLPYKNNYLGFHTEQYGISEYKELTGGFSYAKKFNRLSIGIGADYSQIKILGYRPHTGFALKVGGQYLLNDLITLGLNLVHTIKGIAVNAPTPSILSMGFSYIPTNKVLLGVSFLKDEISGIKTMVGVEYKLSDRVNISAGINTLPFKQFAGLGLNYPDLSLYINLKRAVEMGFTPQIELRYAF